MHSLRISSSLTWYFSRTRSRRFSEAMFFWASSTSRAPRCSCSSVNKRRCPRSASSTRAISSSSTLFCSSNSRDPPVDLLAFVPQRFDLLPRFRDLRLRLAIALQEGLNFPPPLFHQIAQLGQALFQRPFLVAERRAQLLLRGQRHFGFRQRGASRLPLLAEIFQRGRPFRQAGLGLLLARFRAAA